MNGIRLHYEVCGEGTPHVLTHGFGEGRGFESRFPLQNAYTLRKAGHFAQPFTLPTRQPTAFWADVSEPPAPGMQHYDEIVRAEAVAT